MKNEDIIIINLDFVNAFVLKVSGEFILIDTGMPFHWEKLESELIAAGCVPGKLKLIILTHGDVDHVGNCTKLREMYKCKIAMHKDDSHMVENGIPLKRKVRPLTGKIFFLIRKLKRRKLTFEKFKPDIYLSDGQNLNEYGLMQK
jgi:hydroxyacylglutathione hydrolase